MNFSIVCVFLFKIANKKFWKELICLISLHYLKMSFALKPAFAPTVLVGNSVPILKHSHIQNNVSNKRIVGSS
jgi:hypothetical protein